MKQYLEGFQLLNREELIKVNGGYGTTSTPKTYPSPSSNPSPSPKPYGLPASDPKPTPSPQPYGLPASPPMPVDGGNNPANGDIDGRSDLTEVEKLFLDDLKGMTDLVKKLVGNREVDATTVLRMLNDNYTSLGKDGLAFDWLSKEDNLKYWPAIDALKKDPKYSKYFDHTNYDLTVNGMNADMPHLGAALDVLQQEGINSLTGKQASWLGDLTTLGFQNLDPMQREKHREGKFGEHTRSAGLEDMVADIDAVNIAVLQKKTGIDFLTASNHYYSNANQQNRFTQFVENYGGWDNFTTMVRNDVWGSNNQGSFQDDIATGFIAFVSNGMKDKKNHDKIHSLIF